VSDSDSGPPTVRPARPGEAEAIRALGRLAWHAAYDEILGPETVDRTIDEWWKLRGLRRAATDEDDLFLVATGPDPVEPSGEIAGVAHATPDRGEAGVYELGRLYVHPDYWGAGFGSALVDSLRDRVPPGTDRLRLVVLAENEVGVDFYESYGFERVDSRISETDGVEHEELVYELALD
jgi:ribosomal protein S18 acetylase RimI-like enzyme